MNKFLNYQKHPVFIKTVLTNIVFNIIYSFDINPLRSHKYIVGKIDNNQDALTTRIIAVLPRIRSRQYVQPILFINWNEVYFLVLSIFWCFPNTHILHKIGKNILTTIINFFLAHYDISGADLLNTYLEGLKLAPL